MQIGLMMRTSGHKAPGTGRVVRWAELRELAKLAEQVGVDTLFAPDHLIFRNAPPVVLPEGESRGVWEGWTTLTALSQVTSRVTLGPLVICTGFRNPALLAKMADTLDEVSGGRLILGLGAGWHQPEHAAFGYPFDHRVGRFEEALQIIVPLLRQGRVDFAGQYYEARDCELRPRGPRPNGPPIMIGGRKPRMLGLVARYADLYDTDMLQDPAGLAEISEPYAAVDEACRAIRRDPATIRRLSGCFLALKGAEDDPAGFPGGYLSGSTEEIVARLQAFKDAGVEHMTFWLSPYSPRGIEQLGPIVEAAHKL